MQKKSLFNRIVIWLFSTWLFYRLNAGNNQTLTFAPAEIKDRCHVNYDIMSGFIMCILLQSFKTVNDVTATKTHQKH